MEFVDQAIVLSARAHGETHAVAELLTQDHGRWAGLVYGGQGKRMQPILQPGNSVEATWKGRLGESLGHYTLELTEPRAASLMQDRLALAALTAACRMAAEALPERESHAGAYFAMEVLLDNLEEPAIWPALMAKWELGLLSEIGFGLTLDKCAATGSREDLIYISPKSASAVSAQAGEPYKDRLLPLPAFLRGGSLTADPQEAIAALETTGYFMETRVMHVSGKQLPEARRAVIDSLRRHFGLDQAAS